MVSILLDPSYVHGVWCQGMLEGLTAQLKAKRIPFEMVDTLAALDPACRYIFLIGADSTWIRSALAACGEIGVYPILMCNEGRHAFNYSYSNVCSDVPGSMRHLVARLRGRGCRAIALYGVNPESVADLSRLEGYAACVPEGERRVYRNDGGLRACYESFRDDARVCDAVICVNSFAAISLVRRLYRDAPEALDRLTIIGYHEMKLTQFYSRYIKTMRLNFSEYGRAAVTLLECLRKNSSLSHVVMAIQWDLSELDAPADAKPAAVPTLAPPRDAFFEDAEVHEMMQVENLLANSTKEDRVILSRLMRGDSTATIAEQCYFTVSTVKYRLKRLNALCGLPDREALVKLLQKYFSGASLT